MRNFKPIIVDFRKICADTTAILNIPTNKKLDSAFYLTNHKWLFLKSGH